MDHGRVEKTDIRAGVAQEQRQFGSGKNDGVGGAFCLHSLCDTQNRYSCLRQELVLEQFAHILLMDKLLLRFRRRDQRNACPPELLRVEAGLHGEAGTEQAGFSNAEGLRMIGGGPHNAEQRDR